MLPTPDVRIHKFVYVIYIMYMDIYIFIFCLYTSTQAIKPAGISIMTDVFAIPDIRMTPSCQRMRSGFSAVIPRLGAEAKNMSNECKASTCTESLPFRDPVGRIPVKRLAAFSKVLAAFRTWKGQEAT